MDIVPALYFLGGAFWLLALLLFLGSRYNSDPTSRCDCSDEVREKVRKIMAPSSVPSLESKIIVVLLVLAGFGSFGYQLQNNSQLKETLVPVPESSEVRESEVSEP